MVVMRSIARIKAEYNRFIENVRLLYNTLYWHFNGPNNFIVVEGWLKQCGSKIAHRNLGDELNYYLLTGITGKKVIAHKCFYHRQITNYQVIGSVVEKCNEKSEIWGAGAFQRIALPLACKPMKVYAVRGPLTRNYLIQNGVECPAVYGDPALLLPLVYIPKRKKRIRFGIIPHFNDINSPIIDNLKSVYQDCEVIRLRGYEEWTEVIDTIANCDAILSSSLHGLIISDAYKIPNVWVKFSDRTFEGSFKYLDYFGGIGRRETNPIDLNTNYWQEEIAVALSNYQEIVFDSKALLDSCPFEVNNRQRV